jgi:hypothetical protein
MASVRASFLHGPSRNALRIFFVLGTLCAYRDLVVNKCRWAWPPLSPRKTPGSFDTKNEPWGMPQHHHGLSTMTHSKTAPLLLPQVAWGLGSLGKAHFLPLVKSPTMALVHSRKHLHSPALVSEVGCGGAGRRRLPRRCDGACTAAKSSWEHAIFPTISFLLLVGCVNLGEHHPPAAGGWMQQAACQASAAGATAAAMPPSALSLDSGWDAFGDTLHKCGCYAGCLLLPPPPPCATPSSVGGGHSRWPHLRRLVLLTILRTIRREPWHLPEPVLCSLSPGSLRTV